MADTSKSSSIIDWEAVGEVEDLGPIVRLLPPERVIQIMGVEKAVETIGLARVIEEIGPERILEELLTRLSPQQIEDLLRRRQQQG